ncbi:TetR/AcrR family transcriptional regulator [Amycolatopsis taiwanensis]|uniref:TetR family transcriptional regulator n=1 Tax=Amycolatopsis taiwanensis TaxID=342230 RepID=A0A9W6QVG2_9PSEU|nr:TetR/AcrR family transcriptional regulator [Amycolatopsis taiwanensis]GLY63675.1 TetR family transcriptional regulator [Amycolatopsis taiwanensis]
MRETLQERLVRTGLELLADQPAERLSLRQLAEKLDVSHQAPYVHFGSKRRFLAAVAGAGLRRATAQAKAAVASAAEPLARLHALVDAYLRFIRTQPHVHDLAYGPLVAKADHPLLQQAAIEYWDLLHETVAACQPEGTGEEEILRRCAVTWGTVYGLATLDGASVPGDRYALIHEAVDTLNQVWHSQ